jgi:predicted metalloenzyme YecM
MTDDAAVTQGTFADFRLIKGRKVCQIVIEVPIEQADQAVAALGGLPQPATEAWVAIARLETKERVVPLKPDNTKLSLEAVMRCREQLFWKYLDVSNENEAAEEVRRICKTSSRAGLNTDPDAAKHWRSLDSQFLAWKRGAA